MKKVVEKRRRQGEDTLKIGLVVQLESEIYVLGLCIRS